MQSSRRSALNFGRRAWRLQTAAEGAKTQSSTCSASIAATAVRRAYTSEAASTLKNMVRDARMKDSARRAFALPAAVAAALAAGTTVVHCSARAEQTYIMVKPDGVNRGAYERTLNLLTYASRR